MEHKCGVTGNQVRDCDGIFCKDLRPSVKEFLFKMNKGLSDESFICYTALNNLLRVYITRVVSDEVNAHMELAKKIQEKFEKDVALKPIPPPDEDKPLTYGQRLADKIADFGGSWKFILIFLSLIIVWMSINLLMGKSESFDPYPFILLNLMLSCLAALQAPVIMMSQNRQEDKDRIRGEYDFKVDMKAEMEIRLLHEKMDHMLLHQHQNMVEVLHMQLDILDQLQSNNNRH